MLGLRQPVGCIKEVFIARFTRYICIFVFGPALFTVSDSVGHLAACWLH